MPWEQRPTQTAPMPWEARPEATAPPKNSGASDDWRTPFQKFTGALSEAQPSDRGPSDAELAVEAQKPFSERLKNLLAPLNPMNIARGIAQPLQEFSNGAPAEGAGHLLGMLTQPGGPKAEVAPLVRGMVRTGLKVAADKNAATLAGAGVGSMTGHPWIGAGVGRAVSGLARKGLTALDRPPEPEPLPGRAPIAPPAPITHRAAIEPPPQVTPVPETPPLARPAWRQAIVDETNKPADYQSWRDSKFTRTSGGWEDKQTGNMYTDERLHEMYAEPSEVTPAPSPTAGPKKQSSLLREHQRQMATTPPAPLATPIKARSLSPEQLAIAKKLQEEMEK